MHIYKFIISVLLSLISVITYAQDDFAIQLPVCSMDTLPNINTESNTISIRVFPNQSVLVENKRVWYYDEITQEINNRIRQGWQQDQFSLNILLYADKSVRYRVIDWIKTAISNSMSNKLYYMTSFSTTSLCGYQHKTNLPVYRNSDLGKILTTEEEENDLIFWGETFRSIFGPKPSTIQEQYHNKFYKTLIHPDPKNLTTLLNSKKYQHITIKKDGNIVIDNKTKSLHLDIYTQLINKLDLIFVHFDKELLYQDYINYLGMHKKVMKLLKQEKPDHQKVIIEVYEELHDYLFNTASPAYP